MDKKYEDKLRELLDSGISAEEFVQAYIELLMLELQHQFNKQFYKIKHRSNLLAADLI